MSVMILCAVALATTGCLDAVYAIGAHDNGVEWIRTQQAKIEISGRVQDGLGQPLRGVRVHFVREYLVAAFSAQGVDDREDEGHRTVSGAFHLSWNPAESVHLTFEKAGYESVERTFVVRNTAAKGDYGSSLPRASPVVRTGCIVTLLQSADGT